MGGLVLVLNVGSQDGNHPVSITLCRQLWSSGSLPSITYDSLLTIAVALLLVHRFVKMMLKGWFEIDRVRYDPKAAALEYSPFYHLAIVILVLSEIDWNMFDLTLWTLTYIGTGFLRNALFSIKH